MIEWWNSLHRDQHWLIYYSTGVLLTALVMVVSALKDLYNSYVAFIKGEGSEPRTEIDAAYFFMCIFWPLTWTGMIIIAINDKGAFAWLKYLSPSYLVSRIAARRHKALVVTSPNEKVRNLLNK